MDKEKQLLIKHIHFQQEELESALLEVAYLKKKILSTRGYESPSVEADSIEIGWAHEKPPHKHLNFTLRNVRHIGNQFPRLFLRLLEHNSWPGLAIFSSPGNQCHPLKNWSPNGEETGREFMLFFPNDEKINAQLLKASTTDFLLVRECALMIYSYLNAYNSFSCYNEIENWKRVAIRFLDQLDKAHQGMHYDSVKIDGKFESRSKEMTITLSNVFYLSRFVSHIDFQWRTAPKCELLIRPRSESSLLFPDLIQPEAQSIKEFVFPFGFWADPKAKRRAWNRLNNNDKVHLVALVALLPDLITHCIQQNPILEGIQNKLIAEAKYIYAEAIRLSKPRIRKPFLSFIPF